MVKIRFSMFETNSSGTHSICILNNESENYTDFKLPTNKFKARSIYDKYNSGLFVIDFTKFLDGNFSGELFIEKPHEKMAYVIGMNVYKKINEILKEEEIKKYVEERSDDDKYIKYYSYFNKEYLPLMRFLDDNIDNSELKSDLLGYYNDYIVEKVSLLLDKKLELLGFGAWSLDTLIYLAEQFDICLFEYDLLEFIFNDNIYAYYNFGI